jgi:hypothetical protein
MKVLKILFYISFGICVVQLLAYLFGPFGGPKSIFYLIKARDTITLNNGYVISLGNPPYSENDAAKNLHILSIIIRCIYFGSLIACSSLPLFYKMNLKRKYTLGLAFCILGMLGTVLGGMLWRHLVKVYLGV